MAGRHCRLYDENLVHNIMMSTGLSLLEYFRENGDLDSDDICEFIEVNAPAIIEDTIEHLNSADDCEEDEEDEQSWSGGLDMGEL
ncbi:MAG: hypothetical protein ACLFQB_01710 [Chitinispirillaceae bacterium]